MLDIKSLTGAYTMTSLVRNRISKSKTSVIQVKKQNSEKLLVLSTKVTICKPYHMVWFINYE